MKIQDIVNLIEHHPTVESIDIVLPEVEREDLWASIRDYHHENSNTLFHNGNWILERMSGNIQIKYRNCLVTFKLVEDLEIPKKKYINNELGVIAINDNGYKVYEDIVHDMGNGYCRYYIQGISKVDGKGWYYIVPPRLDIPKECHGQIVQDRWIQFPKVKGNG